MRFIERLIYIEPGKFLNPLAQIFFGINIAEGIAFTFFIGSASVQSVAIYSLTGGWPVAFLWGLLLLVLSILNVAMLVSRHFLFARTVAFLGIGAWLYATVLYVAGGVWLQLIIHPLPQVVFWTWYYFALNRYKGAFNGTRTNV